jgi:hypothetical protein
MLFDSTGPVPRPLAEAIIRAVLATDNLAHVCVDSATRQIRVKGQLTREQAAAALKLAGCDARDDGMSESGYAPVGIPCCGSSN